MRLVRELFCENAFTCSAGKQIDPSSLRVVGIKLFITFVIFLLPLS
jgi:hypothetical protein